MYGLILQALIFDTSGVKPEEKPVQAGKVKVAQGSSVGAEKVKSDLANDPIKDEAAILRLGWQFEHPLYAADWSLQQGSDSSQCTLTVPGDDPALVDKLLSLKPYSPPQPTQDPGGAGVGTLGDGATAAAQLDHERLIIAECVRQGITNPDQIAYVLGTAYHESDRFKTLEEYASGSAYEGRSDLGNTQSGDGQRYKGRGYVQLTGRTNYKKYSDKTGKDLIGNPAQLQTDQSLSRYVLVDGMKTGGFTGVGLGGYTKADGSVDFVGARAIVNGSDRADLIADYATNYQQRLRAGDLKQYLSGTPNQTPTKNLTGVSTIEQPTVDAGGMILIRAGVLGQVLYEFGYLLSNVQVSVDATSGCSLTISGVSPLWSINQHRELSTRANLTLKQLAEEVAKESSLTLDFTGDGTYLTHLENNGLTRYQLLLRESERAGYIMTHEGTKLILRPMQRIKTESGELAISIPLTDVLSLSLSSQPGGATPGVTGGAAGTWGAKPVTKQDPSVGSVSQVAPTIKSGTGTIGTPGKADPAAKTTGLVSVGSGKVITEASAQAEVSRVKDFPTKLDLIGRADYLSIRPCQVVAVPTMIQYSDRIGEMEFWVAGCHWSYNESGLGVSLDRYKPGAAVPVSQAMAGQGGVATSAVPTAGGWTHPYPGSIMTAPWGEHRGNRRHAGQDWSGGNGKILAAATGVVSDVENGCRVGDQGCGGGYGNFVDITSNINGKQMLHRYGHLTSAGVTKGQQVTAGQQIGVEGDTGHSFGNHLHFEIRTPSQLWGFGGTIDPTSVGIK